MVSLHHNATNLNAAHIHYNNATNFLADLGYLVTIFANLGKACIKLTFCVVYVYTAELFPTAVRHLAVGSSSMMSRLGGLVAPFAGNELVQNHDNNFLKIYWKRGFIAQAHIWKYLPALTFGVTSLATASLVMFLPETLNTKLPDKFEDVTRLAR